MPTLSAEEFAKRYGSQGGAGLTLSADEFAKRYGGGPAAPNGDPNAGQPQAGPFRRFLQGAGVPTSMDEVKHMADSLDPATQLQRGNVAALAGPVGLAVAGAARGIGSEMGTQAGEGTADAQAGDYGGALRHGLGAAVPLVGPPAAEGNIAGAAGRLTGIVAPEAMHRMAVARAAAPAPLSESLGQIVAAKGRALNPTADIAVEKFSNATRHGDQISALAEKYPNSNILDKDGQFVVKAETAAAPEATATTPPSAFEKIGKHAISSAIGGAAGAVVGGPIGMAVGATAAEGLMAMKSLIQSPLWKATSGAIKTTVGKAMQAQDFSTVTNTAARVLDGQGLDDEFGHDSAVHSLVQTVTGGQPVPPPQLHQMLQDYDAVYIGKNGVATPVPLYVFRQLINVLSSH